MDDGVTGRGTTLITSSQDLFLRQSMMTAVGIAAGIDEDVLDDDGGDGAPPPAFHCWPSLVAHFRDFASERRADEDEDVFL